MKKAIAMSTALIMLIIAISGCRSKDTVVITPSGEIKIGDTGGLELPLDTSSTEISIMVSSEAQDLNNKYVINKLRDITGLNVQVQSFPTSVVQEKVKVFIASSNIPDIIGTGLGTYETANEFGIQGAFARIDEHLDIIPNFRRIFTETEDNKWFLPAYRAEDGHLYGIPYYDINRDVNHGMLYRKDIFDKHNIPLWSSPEEFYNSLKKLKDIFPDSTPFTSKNQMNQINNFSISWGLVAYGPYYDESDKVWRYSDTDDTMKEMLDYITKMYNEGLFDPEFLTMSQASWTSKMTQYDKAFTTFDWIGRLDMFKEQTKETVPEYDLRYAPPIGPNGTVLTLSKVGGCSAVAQGKNTELALKLTDFLLSDAGAELITMGIEGETYVLDDNNMARYIEYDEGAIITINDLEEKYGMFINGIYKKFDRRSIYYNFTEREQEAQDYALKNDKFEPADPKLAFTSEEKAIITAKTPALKKAAEEFFSRYILGSETGNEAWESWKKQAKSLGSEDIVDVYNSAQERYDEILRQL